ncbi:MAG: response regulator [Candidatus Omnitrophica bacterium]|nr:response regulator [Candidatus Omnitrophota bacterium]
MMKVLFIDREEENCAILQRYLCHKGIDLITEKDPHNCVDSCRVHKPSVVMIEAHLGLDIDGIEVLDRIKKDCEISAAKVIILSGLVRADDYRKEALRLGADDFIVKPVDPIELFERIQKFNKMTHA